MDGIFEEPQQEPAEELAAFDDVKPVLDQILVDALKMGASEIRLEPQADQVRVRFRTDGSLITRPAVAEKFKRSLVAVLKVRAQMDIIERRKPQSGMIAVNFEGSKFEFLVSSLPCTQGEDLRIQIRAQAMAAPELGTLGLEKAALERLQGLLQKGQGLVLFAGLKASGKTSTLYAAAASVASADKTLYAIAEAEPFLVPGLNRVMPFAWNGQDHLTALRAALRHDPDLVLVQGLYGHEAMEMELRAAGEGRLILASLHVPGAVEAVTRLLDAGLNRYQIRHGLRCVVAQQLLKGLCPHCRVEEPADAVTLKAAGLDPEALQGATLYRGKGCERCSGTGSKGRVAVFEVLTPGEAFGRAILEGRDNAELARIAKLEGMQTMREHAIVRLKKGELSLQTVAGLA